MITLTEFKEYLGETLFNDLQLQIIVDSVSRIIQERIGREILSQEYADETHDGHGYPPLYLHRRPLTAVSSVMINDVEATDYKIRSTEESELNKSELIGSWQVGVANIKVTYTAGYSAVPDDLKMACYQLSSSLLTSIGKAGTIESEKLGDYSYKLAQADPSFIGSVESIVNKYRQVAM